MDNDSFKNCMHTNSITPKAQLTLNSNFSKTPSMQTVMPRIKPLNMNKPIILNSDMLISPHSKITRNYKIHMPISHKPIAISKDANFLAFSSKSITSKQETADVKFRRAFNTFTNGKKIRSSMSSDIVIKDVYAPQPINEIRNETKSYKRADLNYSYEGEIHKKCQRKKEHTLMSKLNTLQSKMLSAIDIKKERIRALQSVINLTWSSIVEAEKKLTAYQCNQNILLK